MTAPAAPPLLATYRLQLTAEHGFDAAAALVPYLAALGVSHLYVSPIMEAVPGSTHGYDAVDPGRVREELGGDAGLGRLTGALAAAGLGLIVDIVPNHMAAHERNPRWWDVLENGPSSRYAAHFDVDWTGGGDDRIRLPVLATRYGRALASGDLHLERTGADVAVVVHDGLRLPVAPRSLGRVLAEAARRLGRDELAFLADALTMLPAASSTDRPSTLRRHRDRAILRALAGRLLGDDDVAATVDAVLREIAGDPASLDTLLEWQPYRLAFWRTQRTEMGYRRFFDVASLIGVRVELPHVFDDVHARILGLVGDGSVTGLRVDHVDGLRDPAGYLARLRAAAPAAWIGVEKIRSPAEPLPPWPIDGTTGYELGEAIGAVLVDPTGEAPLTALAERFTGEAFVPAVEVRRARCEILAGAFHGELRRLSRLAMIALAGDRRFRDVGDDELVEALTEVLAGYPVYRTYFVAGEAARPDDLACVARAADAALEARPELDGDLVAWLRAALALGGGTPEADELALATQQVTGAVMAKAVEDTVFYRQVRLLARNEVGADPAVFALDRAGFHACMAAAARSPRALVATSTHDSKRSGDVRARLTVLAELPDAWSEAVESWSVRAERHRRGALPDRHAEYVMWQTIVGAWPLDAERLTACMEKSIREAKRVTAWTRVDAAYEEAVRALCTGVLADEALCADIAAFVDAIAPAGWRTGLSQTLLKLTVPGVPDLYQGSELWNLRLVDPDNRAAVDFAARRAMLAELGPGPATSVAMTPPPGPGVEDLGDGRAKLRLIREALALRRRRPEAFGGGYQPLAAEGGRADHVLAFVRGDDVIAVAPRWTANLSDWADTRLVLPAGTWRDVLTGVCRTGPAPLADLTGDFPVALLERD